MKTAAVMMLFVIGVIRVGPGVAAPLADLTTASLLRAYQAGSFVVHSDGAHYRLGSGVGLFVDYKEMTPANAAFSALQTGLPAMPPRRLGGFVVSAGIRVYLK